MAYEPDEHFCHNCEDDTPHLCRYDDHERDSSNDHFICQVCKWEYFGVSGEYTPPYNYEDSEE